MASASGNSVRGAKRSRRIGLVLVLALAAGALYAGLGPHRRVLDRWLEVATRGGLHCKVGGRSAGIFASSLRDVRISLDSLPGVTAEIGRIEISHWPLREPSVSIAGAHVDLRGEPTVLFAAIARAWPSSRAKLAYRPFDVTYSHRILGQLRLDGVTLHRQGDAFEIQAARVRLAELAWQDVRLFLRQRRTMLAVGFGAEPTQGRTQLACFPSTDGMARFLLDVPHQPARSLAGRLGVELGDDFAATQVAGTVSMEIPDDPAQPMRGRVQLVVDRWPTFTPGQASPLLGSTFALLSNVLPAADGSRWLLPRVELTMPVFSLVGKGSIEPGRPARFQLDVEGERTCRQLHALLPPSPERERVRGGLDHPKGAASVRLWLGWDTNAGSGLRPRWRYQPGCGLDPWPEGGT